MGQRALFSNNTGSLNSAFGRLALSLNLTGNANTAIGTGALAGNNSGDQNTAIGQIALLNNTSGYQNTAIGAEALLNNANGWNNTALGYEAGQTYATSGFNTFIGAQTDASAPGISGSTAIGYGAVVDVSSKIRVGNAAVTSIGGQVGWTTFSDGRFKDNVTENIPGLDFILKLRPVTYTANITAYNTHIGLDEIRRKKEEQGKKVPVEDFSEQENIRYTGFIAQEVEQAAKELNFDFSGIDKPLSEKSTYGLRYGEFVVPLVKAVQEQQEMIENLLKQNEELIKRIERLEER